MKSYVRYGKRNPFPTKVQYLSRHYVQKLQFNFSKMVFYFPILVQKFLQIFFGLNCLLVAMVWKRRDSLVKTELPHLLSECCLTERSTLLSSVTYLKNMFADGLVLYMIATCYTPDRSMSPLKVFVQPIYWNS